MAGGCATAPCSAGCSSTRAAPMPAPDSPVVGPASAAHLVAGDLQFVADHGARLGPGTIVNAHIEAPSIRMGPQAVFSGRIRGEKVTIGRGTALFVEGGCGDGFLDAGEEC